MIAASRLLQFEISLLILLICFSTVEAAENASNIAASFLPPASRHGQPRCTTIPDAVQLEQPSHDSFTDVPCTACVRMNVFRCPSVRTVSLKQCDLKVEENDVWRGFAHLITCEVLWKTVEERLANDSSNVSNATLQAVLAAASSMRILNGTSGRTNHSGPFNAKPFATLNLSRRIERFDVDSERVRVALLLNPESTTDEPSAFYTCGLMVTSQNSIVRNYRYMRLSASILKFKNPPEIPTPECRMQLSASRGAELQCAINATRAILSHGPWFLEWCTRRCYGECSRCPFVATSTSTHAHSIEKIDGEYVELQESCTITGSESISIGLVPDLLHVLTSTRPAFARVLDAYTPFRHHYILRLPPAEQLQAEVVSPTAATLKWAALNNLPVWYSAKYCIQVRPARKVANNWSDISGDRSRSEDQQRDVSPQAESECSDVLIDKIQIWSPQRMILRTIVNLLPDTHYTFTVRVKVQGAAHWSPAINTSAVTPQSMALANPSARTPLCERLGGGGHVRLYWENPAPDELGGRLVETGVEWTTQQRTPLDDPISYQMQSKAPLNWATLPLDKNDSASVALRSYTAIGTDMSRAATRVTLSPELERLTLENICWIEFSETRSASESSVVIEKIGVKTAAANLKEDTLEVSTVLCPKAINSPCVIQSDPRPDLISHRVSPSEVLSIVSASFAPNSHHSGRLSSLRGVAGALRVGVALSTRTGQYSALRFEDCESAPLGIDYNNEETSDTRKGCGVGIHLEVVPDYKEESLLVKWVVDRCVLSGRRPLAYAILVEATNSSYGTLSAAEECGLKRFPRDKITAHELYYPSILPDDCTGAYSRKINIGRQIRTNNVIVTLGARLESGIWYVKRRGVPTQTDSSLTILVVAAACFVLIVLLLLIALLAASRCFQRSHMSSTDSLINDRLLTQYNEQYKGRELPERPVPHSKPEPQLINPTQEEDDESRHSVYDVYNTQSAKKPKLSVIYQPPTPNDQSNEPAHMAAAGDQVVDQNDSDSDTQEEEVRRGEDAASAPLDPCANNIGLIGNGVLAAGETVVPMAQHEGSGTQHPGDYQNHGVNAPYKEGTSSSIDYRGMFDL